MSPDRFSTFRKLVAIAAVLLFSMPAATQAGVPGATDVQPAATLLVPFFETGVTPDLTEDTLIVFTNDSTSAVLVHYEVWDIDGIEAGIFDTVEIPPRGTLPLAMRDVIAPASEASKSRLRQGNFYRGFVTADVVTERTVLLPFDAGYPFAGDNVLTGWVYYTRLFEGSSNGLPMVHLEWADATADDELLVGFYGDFNGNRVEQIDADARGCASSLIRGDSCFLDAEQDIDEMAFRVFLADVPLNGTSRIIVFTLHTEKFGGPSVICPSEPTPCADGYPMRRYDESGTVVSATTLELDHVVNVIPVGGNENGWVAIRDIPTVNSNLQVYGFAFNQAQPQDAALNWDAIFEATITP